jgi:hypothetical protein
MEMKLSDFTKSGCRDHMKKYVSSGDSVCPLELEVKVAAKQHHNHGVRLRQEKERGRTQYETKPRPQVLTQ